MCGSSQVNLRSSKLASVHRRLANDGPPRSIRPPDDGNSRRVVTFFCSSLYCGGCIYLVLVSVAALATSQSIPRVNTADKPTKPTIAIDQVETYDLFKKLFDGQPSKLQQRLLQRALRQQKQHQQSATNTTQSDAGASLNGCQPSSGGQQDAGQSSFDTYFQTFGYTQARVSDFFRPTFYTLRLKVDPTKRKFTGQLMIALDVESSSSSSQKSQEFGGTNSAAEDVSHDARTGEFGYRYITMHSGGNISIRKAFYVFNSRASIQIPATRIGRNVDQELLTLDFHPNAITPGQGLLLLVYTGLVNETESHGLFVHRSQKLTRKMFNNSNPKMPPVIDTTTDASTSGLATHMEPNFARRLFPSWDEPHLKARFNLIVVLPFRGYESLSNMAIKRKSISVSCSGEPLQEIEFHTTPTMSTYLLTLVIGRFEYIESITPNNCKVRAYFYANQTSGAGSGSPAPATTTTNLAGNMANLSQLMSESSSSSSMGSLTTTPTAPSNDYPMASSSETNSLQVSKSSTVISQSDANSGLQQPNRQQATANQVNHRRQAAQMALDLAVKTFDRLETLLDVKYPLAKFDMIALRDFNGGGMENWGASIFHESYLLCDNASQADIRVNGGSNRPKRLVVPLVVAHEIAHQWFGNLLTAHSWTYLWLNEGFAQLLMYDIADNLYPNENYWYIFTEDSRNSAMREDELVTSSRPLEYVAQSGSDQLSLFDQLTYNKGAMIVRMLQILLGRRQLFASLRYYLLKHAYDSVTSHDLFQALEESTGREDRQLESLMVNWLRQDGFPLLSVRIYDEGAASNSWRLEMSQERFTLLPAKMLRDQASNESNVEWSTWSWSIPVLISSELNPMPSSLEPLLGANELTSNAASQVVNSNVASFVNYRAQTSGAAAQPQSGFLLTADQRQSTVLLPKSSTGAWFKLNFNATGYYRVHYEHLPSPPDDQQQQQINQQQQTSGGDRQSSTTTTRTGSVKSTVDMLALMEAAVRTKSMCVIDRLNLIDDLFALVLAGKQSTSFYLKFVMRAHTNETEPAVLRSVVNSFARIKAIVSNGDSKLSSLLDRLVQKYLNLVQKSGGSRLVSRSNNQQASGSGSSDQASGDNLAAAPGNNQQQQSAATKELEELIGVSRVLFNDEQFQRQAADLFFRHFRQTRASSPFDSMDREMRASIYSAATLMDAGDHFATGASSGNVTLAVNFISKSRGGGSSTSSSGYVTNSSPLGAHSWVSSIFAPAPQQPAADSVNTSSVSGDRASSLSQQPDVFLRLLGAYETSDSSGERYALSSALGSAQWPNKQLMLLNLTLHHNYFRQQDAQPLLDSMARSKLGRQNIWQTLLSHSKTLEQRQLFEPFLKSLAHGLIETPQGEIESQLRELYRRHSDQQDKLIVQTLELVRINTLWFNRDHESLARFLQESAASGDIE